MSAPGKSEVSPPPDGAAESGAKESSVAQDWFHRSSEEILAALGSSVSGLSAAEVARRLKADGPNELKEGRRRGALQIFLGQFKGLIIWVLIGAGSLSGLLGEWGDAVAILAIVALNAAVGFYQEFRAERSIAALKSMAAPSAKVRRDGAVTAIAAAGIVAGDILQLEAGDLVAADARLIEAASLKCIESALTGESEAVDKEATTLDAVEVPLGDRTNLVFMGTSVVAGTGQAVVVATAMNTELGRIASLIDDAATEERTPLQRNLDSFGRILVWAALGVVALLFGLGLWRGTALLELTLTSVSLAVAAVPEGLPAMVTVALSLGVVRMARRRALVRRLPAVETLGSTTVICTDKTGTLTVGEMTVRAMSVAGCAYEVTGEGYAPVGDVRFEGGKADGKHTAPLLELATILVGSNNSHLAEKNGVWTAVGDPTEAALMAAGLKAGGAALRLEQDAPRWREFPFDSDRKRGTVIRRMPGGSQFRALTNGAPGTVLQCCAHVLTAEGIQPLTETSRREILAQAAAMAKRALRVLASAFRDLGPEVSPEATVESVETDMVFVGLTGMYDPPRAEAKAAVARCREAGIRVVMITGDHPETALAVARELGIAATGDNAIGGVELEKMGDEELGKRVAGTAVYARVTARHKLRIVRAWKAQGAVVAMTGDGVNDAPAIQGADIGIAMGKSGTEVTKQAADMIVTDDNFATIVAAVEEGRGIYSNIRKTLQYLLAGNTAELLLMAFCVLVGLPAALLPIHLLWVNLVTDGLPAMCLATDAVDPDVMLRPPRSRTERITDRGFLPPMLLTGFVTAGVSFGAYLWVLREGTLAQARTEAFTVLVFGELLRAFGARSATKAVWRIDFKSNLHLLAVVVASMGLQVWSHHSAALGHFLKTTPVPLDRELWLLALGAVPLVVLEMAKALRNRRARSG